MKIYRNDKIYWLTILWMTVVSAGGAQSTYTLAECLAQVRTSSSATQQLVLNDQIIQLDKKVTSRNLYPQASFGAKTSWQSDVTSLPIDLPNLEVPTVPNTQHALTLDITQAIYDGGVTKALVDIKTTEGQMNATQYQATLLETERQAINLFYQVALQQKLLDINRLLIDQLAQNIKRAEIAAENGILIKQDVLAIEVKRMEIAQQGDENNALRVAAIRALGRLMGEVDTTINVSVSDFDLMYQDDLFTKRPELAMQRVRAGLIAAQERLSKAQAQPTLGAFLNTGYGRPGLNFLSDQFDFFALGGIKLTVPLSHFYSKKVSLQQESFQLQQEVNQWQKQELTKSFGIQAENYLEEIEKLILWLANDRDIVAKRSQILDVARVQWEEGTLATSEYLNAVNDLSLASARQVSHEILLNRARTLLHNLSGNFIQN